MGITFKPTSTSWMKTGIEQGRQEGLQRESDLILRLLKRKIGQLTSDIESQVKGLDIETHGWVRSFRRGIIGF